MGYDGPVTAVGVPTTPLQYSILIFDLVTVASCIGTFIYRFLIAIKAPTRGNVGFSAILVLELMMLISNLITMFFTGSSSGRALANTLIFSILLFYAALQINVLYGFRTVINYPKWVVPALLVSCGVIHFLTCTPTYIVTWGIEPSRHPILEENIILSAVWIFWVIGIDVGITLILLAAVLRKLANMTGINSRNMTISLVSGCIFIFALDIVGVIAGLFRDGNSNEDLQYFELLGYAIHGLHISVGTMYFHALVTISKRSYKKERMSTSSGKGSPPKVNQQKPASRNGSRAASPAVPKK